MLVLIDACIALEFDPDRFLDERLNKFLVNPFIFLPFNAEPRICLGQQVYTPLSSEAIQYVAARS